MNREEQKGERDAMNFSSTGHPNHGVEGVFERDVPAVPLVSFLDFPDAGKFDGNDMLDHKGMSAAHFRIMDQYSKSALFLLQPF